MVLLVKLLLDEHLFIMVTLEYFAKVRVFLHVQLWEELVAVLELGRIVRRKAILGHQLGRCLCLVGILSETIRGARDASSYSEDTRSIVYSDHEIVYLVELSGAGE